MQLFLTSRPQIKREFDSYLWDNAKRVIGNEGRLRQKSAHQYFIKLCEEAKLSLSEWPLSAKKKGRGAVRLYMERFIRTHYDDIVQTHYGQKAGAKANTGTGKFSRLTASRNYDVAELDEHSAHFIGSIGIPTDEGVRWMELGRLTLIVVADRKGTVLGAKVICRREADSEDILDALEAAFGGTPPHEYTTEPLRALQGAFPISLGPPFDSCGFNQLLLDNALAHIADPVLERARRIGGFDINYGPVARFERRPVIERIFGEVERLGFHRLRSTTGTGSGDPRRHHAERAAIETKIEWGELIDLVMAVLADANGRQGKPNFGRSHLDHLRDLVEDVDGTGMIFPVLPPPLAGEPPLTTSIVSVTVRGSKQRGRRPHVNFQEEQYVGEALANRWELLNVGVQAHYRRTDIRTLDLYTTTGAFIDKVTVTGRWRHSAHSIDHRRHINWLIRSGYLSVRYDEDPVHVHLNCLKERIAKDRPKSRRVTRAMVQSHAEEMMSAGAGAGAGARGAAETAPEPTCSEANAADAPPDEVRAAPEESWRLDDLESIDGAPE